MKTRIFFAIFMFFPLVVLADKLTGYAPELLEKSGLKFQLEQMPAAAQQQLAMMVAQGMPLERKQQEALNDALPKAFNPEKMMDYMISRLDELFEPEDYKVIFEFLDSSLGKKIITLEKNAGTPESVKYQQENMQALMEEASKDSARLALYQSLDRAMKATEMMTEIGLNISLALSWAYVNMAELPHKPTFEQIKADHERQRFMMKAQMAEAVLTSMAMAYQDLSKEELNDYLVFANSPAGKKYFGGVGKVLGEAMVNSGRELGEIMAQSEKSAI